MMDHTNLAVVELDNSSKARWMVFTISGKEVIGVDSSCRSFCEIVDKYGPIPAMPLPRGRSEEARPGQPAERAARSGRTKAV